MADKNYRALGIARPYVKTDDPVIQTICRTAKLVQGANGRWQITHSRPEDKGGTRVWRTGRTPTRTTDYNEARRFADRWLDDLITGAAGAPVDLTIEEICADYLITRPQQQSSLRSIVETLGHVRIGELTPGLVQRYRDLHGAHDGDTIRRRLGALKAAVNLARKRGRINVLPYIDMPSAGEGRVRWLMQEQLAFVREKVSENAEQRPGPVAHALKVFVFIASTWGARREAIRDLTWDRVRFDRREVSFKNPDKAPSKKRRAIVHMSDEARTFLLTVWVQAGQPRDGRVITVSDDSLKNAMRKFFTGIGLPWVTSHVFRHTVATHLLEAGESIYHVAQLLADDVKTVEKTYAHALPKDHAGMLERRKLGWR